MAPSAADWNARYLACDTPWDLGGPAALVQRLAGSMVTEPSKVLVPGCGLGHDVAALARAGHQVEGLDISPEAVARATARLRSEGLSNAQVREANFLDSSALPAATFDALIEHTCYCAIEPTERHAYVLAAAHTLKPGGLLLGAFLEFEGGGPPFGTSRDELLTRFGAHFEVVLLEPAAERFLAKDAPQLAGVFRRLPTP